MLNRIRGSHHIFVHPDVIEILTLTPARSGKAKPYQIKQLRALANTYRLEETDR